MDIFMLSNGKLTNSKVLLEYALPDIKNSLQERRVKNVLVIPFAVVRLSFDQRVESVKQSLAGLDVNVQGIHEFSDYVQAVRQADALFVSGGNTWYLNKVLHDYGLVEPMREAVLKNDKVYVGWSAGSVICSPNMCTTNDMCIVDAAITSALNFVPFHINPHYIDATIANHMGETRDQRIEEFCIKNPHKRVVAIPEGTWLRLSNAGLSYHSSNQKPLYVFKFTEEKKAFFEQDDINSFMADK